MPRTAVLLQRMMCLRRLLCRDRLARLRAYKRVQFTQGEKPIFDFINQLALTTFLLPSDFFCKFVSKNDQDRAVLAFRQKLLRATLDRDLSAGVMMMVGGSPSVFIARLPGVWRKALSLHGLKIHRLSLLFWGYVLWQKFREAIEFYRYFGKSRAYERVLTSYALLLGLPPRAFTGLALDDDKPYSNFVSWFRQRYPKLNLQIVTGAAQAGALKAHVQFKADMWPSLRDDATYLEFRKYARYVLWHSLLGLLKGRWEYIFMARDIIEFRYMSLVADSDLPQLVIVTNSHYVHRPLWSYNLEDRGIETGIYFYSTNTFNMALHDGEYGLIYGYNLMSWSHYYTATPEHAAFLEGASPYPKKISIVGTIPLEDNDLSLPKKVRPVVAYFDVQPFRDAFMAYIGRPSPVYFYEASRRNFEDLVAVCKARGFDLVLKPKRDVGNRLCPRYKRLIEDMVGRGDIKIIDSYIAADRVVAWADAVVSQPFTSVAIVGRELGKASVYYDSLCLYKKEQIAAQGIDVLQNQEDLSLWLQGVSQDKQSVV